MKLGILMMLWSLVACSTTFYRDQTVEKVDIPRFMGKWYVIASIPIFVEKEAYNAVEVYTLNAEGKIDIDYSFNKAAFDGELKRYPQKGWVHDTQTNAHWKIRPFWPLKFDYLVHYLSEDYGVTVIGVPNRNYLWYMARTPTISEDQRAELDEMSEALGYDLSQIREVPQKWD